MTLIVRKLVCQMCLSVHESSSNISDSVGRGWGSGVGDVGLRVSHGPVIFASYFEYYLMDCHHTWNI